MDWTDFVTSKLSNGFFDIFRREKNYGKINHELKTGHGQYLTTNITTLLVKSGEKFTCLYLTYNLFLLLVASIMK